MFVWFSSCFFPGLSVVIYFDRIPDIYHEVVLILFCCCLYGWEWNFFSGGVEQPSNPVYLLSGKMLCKLCCVWSYCPPSLSSPGSPTTDTRPIAARLDRKCDARLDESSHRDDTSSRERKRRPVVVEKS